MKRTLVVFVSAILIWCDGTSAHDLTSPGQVSWHLLIGPGTQKSVGSNLHLLVGSGFSVGVGQHMCLEVVPTYSSIVSEGQSGGSYLADIPLALYGFVALSESVRLAAGGGVGVGFSNMLVWEKSNRALTGHLGISAVFLDRQSSLFSIEFRLVKASTSTGNATLGYLLLRGLLGI